MKTLEVWSLVSELILTPYSPAASQSWCDEGDVSLYMYDVNESLLIRRVGVCGQVSCEERLSHQLNQGYFTKLVLFSQRRFQ